MKNPAREKFLPMLSPYVDGELTPEERQQVDQHLQNNKESAAQVADFRAGDGLMRNALDLQADDVDWKKFTEDVMARVTPEKLPLFERLKLTLSEMFLYQRGPMVAGLVGAAAAVAIAIPLTMSLVGQAPVGYGAGRVEVQTVSVDTEATVKPVVFETESGDAVIWVVDAPEKKDGGRKKGGGSDEEDIAPVPPTDEPKQQDL
ncbi:MAG: zf-HC2 domain-containing protein [Myxococcus sp.]|nr:zf-HC2 domain-containing protein [Myxococcus sp.]